MIAFGSWYKRGFMIIRNYNFSLFDLIEIINIFQRVNQYGSFQQIIYTLLAVFFAVGASAYGKDIKYSMKVVGKHGGEVLVFSSTRTTQKCHLQSRRNNQIWSLPDGKELLTLTDIGKVNNISFSGNDKWLARASSDPNVRFGTLKQALNSTFWWTYRPSYRCLLQQDDSAHL